MNTHAKLGRPCARGSSGPRIERICRKEFHAMGIADLSPVFASREEGAAWLAIYLRRVPPANQPKERACLCCGKGFESEGFHNRMCGGCRVSASNDETAPFSFGAIHGRKRA